MVKISHRRYLGLQSVYDLGVRQDHNFVLANQLVASNCFNKSHSTAYAYVTYQTAYLKANYPVEYMAALLTASSDNQEKVDRYRENCQKMGIIVEKPDINRSQKDFTPNDKKILFGLSAVKNLGEAALENILAARQKVGGNFKSLGDFCTQVDLRAINRRSLETLIFCGAFDAINPNRNQLIHDLDLILPWAQRRLKEQQTGQTSLFDLIAPEPEEKGFEQEPQASSVADFSLQEKLKLEKENLGFYVSEHPLKSIENSTKILSPINLSQLPEQKSRKRVSVVVLVNALKKIMTKKGEPMAFLQLEDITGQAEAVVFPSVYPQIESLLSEDSCLVVWGKVEHKDEEHQLIIEQAEAIEKIQLVMVDLSVEDAYDPIKQNNLRSLFPEQKGRIPIVLRLKYGNQTKYIRLGQEFWVQDPANTLEALTQAGFTARSEALIPN